MYRWLIGIALVVASIAHADETLAPVATPTPDYDPIASYGWSSIEIHNQIMAPDGTQAQQPMVSVTYVALRADGTCSKIGNRCRTINQGFYDSTATNMIAVLNTANMSTNTLTKRVLNFGLNNGILPTGSVVGTPGITIQPTPTAAP